jgi:L-ascorbate metabolism protein UlaG (beta-lactamase superfamily)
MSGKISYFGHAALYIQMGSYHLWVDPFLSDNPSAPPGVNDLPVDYILVTHGHSDHLGETISIANRSKATVISNDEIIKWLEKKGVQKTHGQHIGGGYNYPFGYLKLTLALHGSMLPDGSNGGNPAGFLITGKDGKKIYLAGDTGLFGDMRLIGEEGIDLAVLPIGDNFTMGPDDALRAVKLLQPKHVIPIHYNTWDLIAQDPNAWAKRVAAETSAEVHVLTPGQSFSI